MTVPYRDSNKNLDRYRDSILRDDALAWRRELSRIGDDLQVIA
jgi:hypothetical protein